GRACPGHLDSWGTAMRNLVGIAGTSPAMTAVYAGPLRSTAQHAAGALGDLGDDLVGERVDLRLGHGLVARLDRHRDGDRFLAGLDALALVHVEHRDAGDQLAIHR